MTMRKLLLITLSCVFLSAGSACVYRANISQGNLIKQEDLDQVETGMTKNQIRFLLGTPMVDDPFSRSRWDYVYYLKIGRDDPSYQRWVTVVFDDDEKVVEIRKDQELKPAF